jgi:hypothetical protein
MCNPRHHLRFPALHAWPISLRAGLLGCLLAWQSAVAEKLPGISADFKWYEHPYPSHAQCLQSLLAEYDRDQQYAAAQTTANQQQHSDIRVWLQSDGVRILDADHAEYRRTLRIINRWIDVERAVEISQSTIYGKYLRCEGALQLEEIMYPAPPGSPGYRDLEPHELPGARSD